ncbi:phage minor capsid protein [Fastidiosipila sanguinis]|uniref:Minor capsid protein n=1 Tax=Fastidiosipila sanguinis TaxID=236753 RepID=A0A2S0KP69_9FIRM|nr:phage minor capsid protein [Fastidiosipila sanguinis]AVM42830.1 hypothetical protein C5Q98_06215 [Fastidiosipila sanguinis]
MKIDEIIKLLIELELEMINSANRNLKRHMREELDEGLKWTQWQVLQRRSLNQYRKELSELANIAFEEIYPIAEEELERSYTEASNEWESEWQKLPQAVKQKPVDFASRFKTEVDTNKINTIDKALPQTFSVQPIDSEESFFNFNKEKLKQVIEDNKSDIDVARYSAVNYSFSQYKDILQKVDIAMQTGTYTLDQAVDKASKEFASRGINSIEYKDGRRVNISTYIEMCLRTSSHRAKLQAEGAWRDRTGNYLVVSADLKTTCDICYKWQAVVLIDDVFAHGKADGKHELLSEAMRDGFLHPNCRHSLNTYFEGITRVPTKSEFDKTKSNYEAERKQRQLELQIRRAKRQEAIAITEEEQIKAQLNVIAWQKKLKKHLKDNPQLKRYPQRERLLDLTPFEKYKNDPERAIKEVADKIKADLDKQPKLYAKSNESVRYLKDDEKELLKYYNIPLKDDGVLNLGKTNQKVRNALKLKKENFVLTTKRAIHIVQGKPRNDVDIIFRDMNKVMKKPAKVYRDIRQNYSELQQLIFISEDLKDNRKILLIINDEKSRKTEKSNSIFSARIVNEDSLKAYKDSSKYKLIYKGN